MGTGTGRTLSELVDLAKQNDPLARNLLIDSFTPQAMAYATKRFEEEFRGKLAPAPYEEALELLMTVCNQEIVAATLEFLADGKNEQYYFRSMSYRVVRATRKFVAHINSCCKSKMTQGSIAIEQYPTLLSTEGFESRLYLGELLDELLGSLEQDDRCIFEYVIGIPGKSDCHSKKEAAEQFGVTEEYVSACVDRVKEMLARELKEYLSD